ncbi:betaine/proline/choline family ABC transporter ATP-binding protein [Oceanobacillus caeni]|uniref:Quaternary amine transport ATP-binding protein n=1 Tax=Oceanobacillus caeni TaxID=405946 RepID=A0ABR5MNX7_9BACI|nr:MULTISPECIES: betaine/proline/choline family ABC transporter ATP-binding protein [Bacillaceae]KKE79606.1 glycine/betaine ABC transporter ATP-binding protein [Bacilli bacterium VT-13-104]PZD89680.1 ATP-binding cassette domain-containing protein [Bacilli bacterium]KPH78762.1 glycine/betaine ABC transporter ATP-binding protein [Oceanobacillus caeni]MBU8790238.1 betaine/proline/choline family ABC transporter ATP-binding protein [Oceanobacillus caeni]MCR1833432.1 betaine/proline/choline family A
MLEFHNVTKRYNNGKFAVNNLNLKIKKGEFICFIGPSGCGKTTTMKMVNRLIDITDGSILVDGKDIKDQDPVALRRSIGYVIQQIGLMPHMTIKENIVLVGTLLKWTKEKKEERARELLKLVDLPEEYLDKYPHELSGGQQQRIGVLRALAANPPLILMDEPFGALDPITRDSLQEEFKKLQRELNKTIVFVTHDMDEAIKLADRIVIMREGEIVQIDTPDEILRNPANEFVEEFLGKERLIQGRPDVTTVGQIMNSTPVTVQTGTTLKSAISTMRDKRVDSLLITDSDNVLKGYLDIEAINLNYKKANQVEEVMETKLYSVFQDSLLSDTVRKILRHGAQYVPVVDDQHRLVGIVTRATLATLVYDTIWGDGTELEEIISVAE